MSHAPDFMNLYRRVLPLISPKRLTKSRAEVHELPLAPKCQLSYWRRVAAIRNLHTGPEELRNVNGPVSQVSLGPRWLVPPVVVTTSPQGGHDAIGRTDASTEKTRTHAEMRHLIGNNLFDLTHGPWLPRRRALQPIFTKQNVRAFAATSPKPRR